MFCPFRATRHELTNLDFWNLNCCTILPPHCSRCHSWKSLKMAFFNPGKNLVGLSKLSFKHQQFDACKLDAAAQRYRDILNHHVVYVVDSCFHVRKTYYPKATDAQAWRVLKTLYVMQCKQNKTELFLLFRELKYELPYLGVISA